MGALTRTAQVFQRVKSWALEGSWRGPFSGQGHLGNWFQLGSIEDGFQRDLRVDRYGMERIPVIAALRHLHRSAFAQLRPHHMREDDDGAITDMANTAQLRVMLRPNEYESGADFSARLADEWMTQGEVLVWGIQNNRFEVDQMHIVPRNAWRLVVDPDTQTVFYVIRRSANDLLSPFTTDDFIVPTRNVMHLRWATPRHPLVGESGFAAAGLAAGIHVALSRSQAAFFAQMRRPSGILSTDEQLNGDQIQRLRAAFDEQAKGMAQGGVPILGWGFKWQPMVVSSEDAEVIATLRMSNEEIARCVGVPGPLIGDLEKSGLTNTEALIEFWLSVSLGGLIERYECGLNELLGLDGRRDWVDMSTEALLRTNLVQRMEGLTKGIQGGVFVPNEARKREGLSPVPGGDQLFLQRQMTPVDVLSDLAAAELEDKQRAPEPSTAPIVESEEEPTADTSKHFEVRSSFSEYLCHQADGRVFCRWPDGRMVEVVERVAEPAERDAMAQAEVEQLLAAAIEPIAATIEAIDKRVDLVRAEAIDVTREAVRAPVAEALLEVKQELISVRESAYRSDRAADAIRAQVAEGLLELERQRATLRDGRDGVGIRAVSVASDHEMFTLELTDDSRVDCPLPRGLPGERGATGFGVDAPIWQRGVYRTDSFVQHYEGRIYRALEDTSDEPGDSKAWQRVGRLGTRWCGPFEEGRAYECGDRYVNGGIFEVLANGEQKCVGPKPLTPSDVRTIARKQSEERESALRAELAATKGELKRVTGELDQARAELAQGREQLVEQGDLVAGLRRDLDAMGRVTNLLRIAVEDQAGRGSS